MINNDEHRLFPFPWSSFPFVFPVCLEFPCVALAFQWSTSRCCHPPWSPVCCRRTTCIMPKHRILERLTPRESTPLSWVIGDLGRLCLDIRSSYISILKHLLSIFDICCYTKVVTDMSRVHHVTCPLSFPGAAEVAPHYGEWTPATPSARFCVCRKSVRGNSEAPKGAAKLQFRKSRPKILKSFSRLQFRKSRLC